MEHHITRIKMEHAFSIIAVGRDTKQSVFVNIYSIPSQTQQWFNTILQKASVVTGNAKLIVSGDFNAMDQSWAYVRTTPRAGT
ncbi:hypothetical protein HPB48_016220 [Haemaphysalis longicornis]|uniref:Endonuclease/exonuclease/phosphatase domain-containing protein n=1 Tax=Haemaphysalis longicornis TaxID=44386 RepID=A0A9J6FBU5_HAELO|nr:hypothetical protein HPB48_016220 [Haemaphysalis longicornis]